MAWAWLNTKERKVRRQQEKQQAMAYAEELTLGEGSVGSRY